MELERGRAVALGDALGGSEDRGEDLVTAVLRADVGEIGADLLADAEDGVAADAHRLVLAAAKEREAARGIALVLEDELAEVLEVGSVRLAREERARRIAGDLGVEGPAPGRVADEEEEGVRAGVELHVEAVLIRGP